MSYLEKFGNCEFEETKQVFSDMDTKRNFLAKIFISTGLLFMIGYSAVMYVANHRPLAHHLLQLGEEAPHFFHMNIAMLFICILAPIFSNMFRSSFPYNIFVYLTFILCSLSIMVVFIGTKGFMIVTLAMFFMFFCYCGLTFYTFIFSKGRNVRIAELYGYALVLNIGLYVFYTYVTKRDTDHIRYGCILSVFYSFTHLYILWRLMNGGMIKLQKTDWIIGFMALFGYPALQINSIWQIKAAKKKFTGIVGYNEQKREKDE